jgi:hypothetical protein
MLTDGLNALGAMGQSCTCNNCLPSATSLDVRTERVGMWQVVAPQVAGVRLE